MLPSRHWQARFIACINQRGIGLSFKMNGLVLPMSARLRSIIYVTAALALPAAPLLAQARPAAPAARPVAAQPTTSVPGAPAAALQPVTAQPAPVLPPPL